MLFEHLIYIFLTHITVRVRLMFFCLSFVSRFFLYVFEPATFCP